MKHEVLVGNIGRVYDGGSEKDARIAFREYEAQSKEGSGRAAGEMVTWLRDNDIHKEYLPPPVKAGTHYKVWVEIEMVNEDEDLYETLDMATAAVAEFKREEDAYKFAHALHACGEEGLKRLMPEEVFYDQ